MTARLYQTDYAGGERSGFCISLENALRAAIRRTVIDDCTSVAVTDMETGEEVAHLTLNLTKTQVVITTIKPIPEFLKPRKKKKRALVFMESKNFKKLADPKMEARLKEKYGF